MGVCDDGAEARGRGDAGLEWRAEALAGTFNAQGVGGGFDEGAGSSRPGQDLTCTLSA